MQLEQVLTKLGWQLYIFSKEININIKHSKFKIIMSNIWPFLKIMILLRIFDTVNAHIFDIFEF